MRNSFKKLLVLLFALSLMQTVCSAKMVEFAQVGDVHYSLSNLDNDTNLRFLQLSLRKTAPQFLVFLGDNVDKSKEADVIGFMQAIRGIKLPYYLAFGNRDAHKISGIEKSVYLNIVSTFNKNQAEKDNYYYFKPNNDVICVVLDDSFDFILSNHGQVSDKQLEWLNTLLKKNPKKLFLIFEHTPVLPPRDDYKYSMLNSENYKELLKKYPNIVLVSSGHYHQSALQTDENGIRHISVPAFKDTPHPYQIIQVIYDKNSYKSQKNVEVKVQQVNI